jgi:hypothetical protein
VLFSLGVSLEVSEEQLATDEESPLGVWAARVVHTELVVAGKRAFQIGGTAELAIHVKV